MIWGRAAEEIFFFAQGLTSWSSELYDLVVNRLTMAFLQQSAGEHNHLRRSLMANSCLVRLVAVLGMIGVTAAVGAVPQGVDVAALDDWDIVVGEEATESEVYAAEEFQRVFALASGKKLPIGSRADRPDRHIFVGPGRAMAESAVGFGVDEYGPEDLRIIIRDNNIAIAGGRPRGTLYGVYTFLEDYLGVRFLTKDHTHVPAVGRWRNVGPVDRFYHPPLAYRWTFYAVNQDNPEFAARLRVNTVPGNPSKTWRYSGITKLGGKTGITLACHSFRYQIPPQKYAAEHPEYYALYKGVRLASIKPGTPGYDFKRGQYVYGMQPCLTHPDVVKIVAESVIEEARAHPEIENFSVSQDDGGAFCQCDKCAPIIKKEGLSGYVLTFVNKVADEVAKECPGKMVSTLAYSDTCSPPNTIELRPNVQIWFSTIGTCFNHDLDDPTCRDSKKYIDNSVYSSYLRKWNRICDNLYVWDYIINFENANYQLPFPNFESIERKTRYLVANGVKGIFFQATGSSYNNDFQDLRNYVASNLAWNPNRSSQQLMKEFLDLHVGRSGEPILAFINYMQQKAKASGAHCRCVGGTLEEFGLGDSAVGAKGLEAFDEAMRLAENETIRTRVEKMSICAYRAALEPVWYIKDIKPVDPELAERMRPMAEQFFKLCDKYDVKRCGEGSHKAMTIEGARERLSGLLGL